MADLNGAQTERNQFPDFAKVAREEGFGAVAKVFESIAVAEKQHEKRFLGLMANVENGTVFKKDTKWSGDAATVGISTWVRKLPAPARPVHTHRHILSCSLWAGTENTLGYDG